ncbi:MAG: hybrid sensor histidine kinase/response regulator, partial [Desulfobacteraceae bacterium]
VIAQALKVVQVSFSSRIKVQTRISKNYPMVLADPSQIHEMIVNLCANAGEAMSETGGILKVILSSTGIDPGSGQQFKDLTPGEYLEMIISDTGSGIDPEIREKIFDPYFTTKEFGKGTGMGLSVVHGIVKTHGGAIAVDCTAGQDTCFRVLLPAAGEDGKQT